MGMENPLYSRKEQLEKYNEKKTVNGIEISVAWDPGYNSFTIYLFQTNQLLMLSKSEQTAKKVFDHAVELAEDNVAVSELFRQIEDFSKDLVRQDDLAVQESSPLPPSEDKAEKGPDKSYAEQTEINGVRFFVNWGAGYGDYVLYFPQADVTKQIIRISDDPRAAKQVFDYAVALAKIDPNVEKIVKSVEQYSRQFN